MIFMWNISVKIKKKKKNIKKKSMNKARTNTTKKLTQIA